MSRIAHRELLRPVFAPPGDPAPAGATGGQPQAGPAIPLVQQIEEVKFAVVRQRSMLKGAKIRELRPDTHAQHSLQKLETAVRTLEILAVNADEIRAFLKLPAEARHAVLKHGETLGQMCLELAKREAIAKAGGPVR